MDLQAILDASDSSDDDIDHDIPSKFLETSSDIDLEQILREDTDDDPENDVMNHHHDLLETTPPWHSTTTSSNGGSASQDKNSSSPVSESYPWTQQNELFEATRTTHNAEEWAILQSILKDADDAFDEQDSSSDNVTSSPGALSMDPSSQNETQDRVDVDAILTQESEMHEEEIHMLEQEQVQQLEMQRIQATVSSPPRSGAAGDRSAPGTPQTPKTANNGMSPSDSSRKGRFSFWNEEKKSQSNGSPMLSELTTLPEDEVNEEKSSRMAFEQAVSYERKLLKAGHREIVSPLMVKRRLKPKIELSARGNKSQRQPQQHASARLAAANAPRFNFSGVVESKTVPDISASLLKHSTPGAKVMCGLPTCLAFNSRFIAVGTQLGIILLYDLFGALRQRLGASPSDDNQGARMAGSITSLDLSANGECCCAGYKTGLLILWDTIRGTVLRSVDDAHPSPITYVRFLSELKVITADVGGLVNKLSFTKNILWTSFSMETDCLLDGTAGQILAMNVLDPFSLVNPNVRPQSSALVRVLRKLTLVALSSERSSFAVAVEPKVSVLHRWSRPPDDKRFALQEGFPNGMPAQQSYLPCLSWGWALVSGGGNVVMPILARAWGCCLQLLCASFPTLDEAPPFKPGEEPPMHWPAFGVHDEVDAETPIVALEWLSDRSLVYLTVTNEFTLVDTVMMTLLERIDFSGLRLVYAEFSLSRSSSSNNMEGDNAESELGTTCMTFQNSIRCSDDRLMVLCQEELRKLSIVGARQRVSSLESDGEWLEALALALDHYESTVISQEDRRRDPNGKKDLSRHPEFSLPKGDEEEWIAKLLIRYLNLAVDNAPEAEPESSTLPLPRGHSRVDLAQSHFQMLAGVCVEFCVVTRRLDLLFGAIFRRFQSVGYKSVFLDVLEPYVLNDKLSYIAPEVMSFFVEHCKARNGVATVERCLLHMDCTILDFDTTLTLLRNHHMYTALFFVFNQGLDDFTTPLEILLEKVFDEADTGNAMLVRRRERNSQSLFERYGYKSILYLQTCFRGKTFPKEEPLTPDDRIRSVKPELLNFLLQMNYRPSPQTKRKGGASVVGHRAQPYPYIRILLQVDPRLALETLSLALDSPDSETLIAGSVDADGWENERRSELRYPSKQEAVNVLMSMILPQLASPPKEQVALVKSRSAVGAFLDFTAKYIVRGVVRVDKSLTFMILNRMADRFSGAKDPISRQLALRQIMEMLSALPRESYDPDKVLALIEKASIHRAALLLHQQVASSWQTTDSDDTELRSRHFRSAIDCFLGDDDPIFRKEVFEYVRKECSGALSGSDGRVGGRQHSLRDALYSRLPGLVSLDALMTARLVAELFVDDLEAVVDALDTGDGGESQFMFFRAIISGDLGELDPVAGSVLNLTMSHHHMYLSLMARMHPEMVYGYLSTHDNYRASDALALCQQYDIADASAYLLERMGNVSSALQLILQTLESRMMSLKRTIRGIGVDIIRQHSARNFIRGTKGDGPAAALPTKQEKEVDGVKRILVVALDLCERNSGSFTARSEQGSQLWFNVLDRLINAKGFLRLSNEQPVHANVMAGVLNELLRMTMQRMVSSVPLTDLVRKVTSDHSGSRLGELNEMVQSLLGTFGFELNVFQSAASVFHQDVQKMNRERREIQVRGSSVCSAMSIPLQPNTVGEIADFFGESTSAWEGTLVVGNGGNATLTDADRWNHGRGAKSDLTTALSKLRNRRSQAYLAPTSSPAAISMMTVTDQLYQMGELEPVVYGERPVGVLGEAEHRGRLMTFQ